MTDLAAKKLPAIDLDDFERRLRHAPPPSNTSEDPLNELARLVAKDDPFKSIFDDLPPGRQPSRLNQAAAPAQMPAQVSTQVSAPADRHAEPPLPQHSQPALQQEGHVRQTQRSAGDDAASRHVHDFEPAYDAAHSADETPAFDDEPQQQRDADAAAPPYGVPLNSSPRFPRKAMFAGIALSAVAIAGVAAAVGYRGLPSSKTALNAPIIKATAGPVKVQPPQSEAEDAAAPSVLDKAAPADAAANAKVVSREEQPSDVAPTVKVKTVRVGDGAVGSNVVPGGATSPPAVAAASTAPAVSSMPAPKRVKTVVVRPDGSIIGDPSSKAAAPDAIAAAASAAGQTPSPKAPDLKAPVAKAADASAATAKSVPAQTAAATVKTTTRAIAPPPAKPQQMADAKDPGVKDPGATGPLQISPPAGAKPKPVKTATRDVPAAPAAPAATAEETVQTTSSTGGAFAVQLAAPATEREAKDASARLQKQYSGALGSYQPGVRKASDKDVYRVRVSNLSKDEADALCGKLKAAGGACFVARN